MTLLSAAYWTQVQKASGVPIAHAVQGSTASSTASKARTNHNYSALNDLSAAQIGYLRVGVRDATGSHAPYCTVGGHERMVFYISFDFYIPTAPASLSEEILCVSGTNEITVFDDGAICSLRCNAARRISFFDGDDTGANTGAGYVGNNTPTRLTDNALDPGWYRGNLLIDRTNLLMTFDAYSLDTLAMAGSMSQGSLLLGGATNDVFYINPGRRVIRNATAIKVHYGDFFVDDAAFQPLATRTWLKEALADGSNTGWTVGVGASKIAAVNGHVSNGNTDYIVSTAAEIYSASLVSSASLGITGNIIAVQPFVGCHSAASTVNGQTRLKDGAANSDTTARAYGVTVDSELGGRLYLTAPSTSAAWTYPGVDAIEVGPNHPNTSELRCTLLGAMMVADGAAVPAPVSGGGASRARGRLRRR